MGSVLGFFYFLHLCRTVTVICRIMINIRTEDFNEPRLYQLRFGGLGSLSHAPGEIWRIRSFSWHIELLARMEVKVEGFEEAVEASEERKTGKQGVEDGRLDGGGVRFKWKGILFKLHLIFLIPAGVIPADFDYAWPLFAFFVLLSAHFPSNKMKHQIQHAPRSNFTLNRVRVLYFCVFTSNQSRSSS